MEHEKKKRQKKKKNKNKPPVSENNNHSNQNLNSENSDVHNKQRVTDSDRESISGAETSHSIEAESYPSNREASIQQKIKELQEQMEVHVLKEADYERDSLQSLKESTLWSQEKVEYERRILELQTEKDCCFQKEAGYQEEVNRLVEKTTTLNNDNARLQAQVMEMEVSINDISHQNQHLKEQVSVLQSKIHTLENSINTKNVMEDEEINTQLESARALIEKLVSENEKLVEKVNYLTAEVDQRSITTDSSFPNNKTDDQMVTNSELDDETSVTETLTETETDSMVPEKELKEGMGSEVIKFKSNNSSNDLNRVSMESGEIVQIPLNENDVLMVSNSKNVEKKTGGGDVVPLTDAPLIGAPFRFISLVARYVSGADLVEKT